VLAEAMPDDITANATMNVKNGALKARPEDVADDEDGKDLGADGPAEAGVLLAAFALARPARCARGRFHAHRSPEGRLDSNQRQAVVNCVAASSA
jgi:hypothetical protein